MMLHQLQLFQLCPVQICLPAKTFLPQKEMVWGANAVTSVVLINAGMQGGSHPTVLVLLQAGQVLSRQKSVNLQRLSQLF